MKKILIANPQSWGQTGQQFIEIHVSVFHCSVSFGKSFFWAICTKSISQQLHCPEVGKFAFWFYLKPTHYSCLQIVTNCSIYWFLFLHRNPLGMAQIQVTIADWSRRLAPTRHWRLGRLRPFPHGWQPERDPWDPRSGRRKPIPIGLYPTMSTCAPCHTQRETRKGTHLHTDACPHVDTQRDTYTWTHTQTHGHRHGHKHTDTHTWMDTREHTHARTHTYIQYAGYSLSPWLKLVLSGKRELLWGIASFRMVFGHGWEGIFFWLLIDARGSSPLWAVPSLGGWAWNI